MDMPKPGPDQEKLNIFLGEWRGKETMAPSQWMPEGGVRDAVVKNRLGVQGMAVIQDYAQLDNGAAVYEGHAVISKKNWGDGFQIHWFDMFAPSVFNGDFDGKRGVFISESPMGKTRATWDFKSDDAYSYIMEMSQDGETWSPLVTGEYVKV